MANWSLEARIGLGTLLVHLTIPLFVVSAKLFWKYSRLLRQRHRKSVLPLYTSPKTTTRASIPMTGKILIRKSTFYVCDAVYLG
ncbi:hypothetical protein BKA66DRAFT_472464 [Pyrenochaeta sp. MPI-SDFR-AT-0127]|nr:hypothetical protein BKA66DRAFT_472464 [Pyrenochaeta sp. MPI-SDFR-AT-0127]